MSEQQESQTGNGSFHQQAAQRYIEKAQPLYGSLELQNTNLPTGEAP